MEFDENGDVIATTGSWLAGTNGARPGIIMPGTRLVGGGYYEEIAPSDSALDKARITKITEECEVGEFNFDKQGGDFQHQRLRSGCGGAQSLCGRHRQRRRRRSEDHEVRFL